MSNSVVVYIANGKQLINPSNTNPDRGYVTVKSETMSMVEGSFIKSVRYSLLRGNIADLEALGLTEGCDINPILRRMGIPAQKISILETTSPQWVGQPQKVNKDGQPQFTAEGVAIYRSTNLTSLDVNDVLIKGFSLTGETVEGNPTAVEEGVM